MNEAPGLFSIGLMLVLAMIAWEGIRFGINYLLGRATSDNYVTRDHCTQCPARSLSSVTEMNDLKKEIRENFGIFRGILLVVALKAGVPTDELRDLMR